MVSIKRGLKYLIGLGTLTIVYTFLQIQHQERRREIVSKHIQELSFNSKWETAGSPHTKDVSHSISPTEGRKVVQVRVPKPEELHKV